MPGVDLLRTLTLNPSLVTAVQRGVKALGPGAEVMAP